MVVQQGSRIQVTKINWSAKNRGGVYPLQPPWIRPCSVGGKRGEGYSQA